MLNLILLGPDAVMGFVLDKESESGMLEFKWHQTSYERGKIEKYKLVILDKEEKEQFYEQEVNGDQTTCAVQLSTRNFCRNLTATIAASTSAGFGPNTTILFSTKAPGFTIIHVSF